MTSSPFLILLISHTAASVIAAVLAYRSNPRVRDFCKLVWQQANGAIKLGTFIDDEMTIPLMLREVVAPIAYYYFPILLAVAGSFWIITKWMQV